MTSRLNQISSHLSGNLNNSNLNKLLEKKPDDIVITAAYRTAVTKGKKGGFKDTKSVDLLLGILKGILEKSKIDPSLIGDVIVGNVLSKGAGALEYRAASLAAGIPYTVPFASINRQCSSGLISIMTIVREIQSGQIDIGIGAGVESMTNDYGAMSLNSFSEKVLENDDAKKCLIPMGITSENVADKYNISRNDQDNFAVNSFKKAEFAQKSGYFNDEIIPIETEFIDPVSKEKKTIVVDKDDGIRYNVDIASLSKIRPAFKKNGTTTAGNSSQVSDGAAAVLLMKRSTAERLNQKIIGKFIDGVVVGVPPEIMGVGPAFAIPHLLNKVGISVNDVDVYEINEAFASQAIYSCQAANIDINKVNPQGGAIALGHPLGCTGARQYATIFPELKRMKKRIGVTSMCIGTGMGAASLVVAEY